MKIFNSMCKDKITGMEMIAEECSFNMACLLLENKMRNAKYLGCESMGVTTTKIKFNTRNFYYDEERGVLLGE